MRKVLFFFVLIPLIVPPSSAQTELSLELSSAFPLTLFQNGPREYFMTTKYDLSVVVPSGSVLEFVGTATFTQQQPIMTQDMHAFTGHLDASRPMYIPFTTDPLYPEYGFYGGIRLKSQQNIIRAFVTAHLGATVTRYGTVDRIPDTPSDPMPGGPYYRSVEGSVVHTGIASMYGGGLLLQPFTSVRIIAGMHAVDRLTKQPIDVYRSIGLQFAL